MQCISVFRELLQNSDDASSKAVEIHFETKPYVTKQEAGETVNAPVADDGAVEKLPDLKTAIVCPRQCPIQWLTDRACTGSPVDIQE